ARTHLARSGLDVDDLAVNVRQREADRARLADSLARVRVRDRRRLGQAVPLEDLAAGEILEPLHDLDREGRGARHEPLDRPQVVFRKVARPVAEGVTPRGAREETGPVSIDRAAHVTD